MSAFPERNNRQARAVVHFHKLAEPYGEFSNFARSPITLRGRSWPTVEHYFQAQKFDDPQHRERIRHASTPKEAKRLGWSRTVPIRKDWEEVKQEVMRRGVRCKFETHAALRELLLSTGDEEIVENAPGDYYWGCGADGSGKNRLGVILMEVRAWLRERQSKHHAGK